MTSKQQGDIIRDTFENLSKNSEFICSYYNLKYIPRLNEYVWIPVSENRMISGYVVTVIHFLGQDEILIKIIEG